MAYILSYTRHLWDGVAYSYLSGSRNGLGAPSVLWSQSQLGIAYNREVKTNPM